jgi:hypothetical protein
MTLFAKSQFERVPCAAELVLTWGDLYLVLRFQLLLKASRNYRYRELCPQLPIANSTVWIKLKMAVFAPIPKPRISTAVMVKPRDFKSTRIVRRSWEIRLRIGFEFIHHKDSKNTKRDFLK